MKLQVYGKEKKVNVIFSGGLTFFGKFDLESLAKNIIVRFAK